MLPFLLAAVAAPAPQPPAAAFDLAGALARARAENALLKAAKARVEERTGLITATRADALPQLTFTGDFTRIRDVSFLVGDVGPTFAQQFGISPSQLVSPYNVYTAQATVSQPLFYWGKLGTALKVAQMGEQEASLAYTTVELDTLHGVARAYIGVLAAQAELEVVQARLATAETFVADIKAKLDVQAATELDLLRAES
jgi:outer membrane protein TolC